MFMVKGTCSREFCGREVVVVDNTEETLGAPIFCRRCAIALSTQVDDLFKSLQAAIGAANRVGQELSDLRRKGGSA